MKNTYTVLVAELGLEPRISGNGPDVLPLHYPAMTVENPLSSTR